MKTKDAMSKTISTARPDDTLEVIARLMKKEDAGFIPICEGEKLVGVITDRDIVLRGLAEDARGIGEKRAKDLMSRDVITVDSEAELDEAARLMNEGEIRRLPVLERGRLVGVLSHGNLVQATGSEGPGDRATLGVTKGA